MSRDDDRPVRPTIRCFQDDLGLFLPPVNDPLHEVAHPVIEKAQRTPAEVASNSAERIKALSDWVWFKQRAGRYRSAITHLPDSHKVAPGWWIGAAGQRSQGDADDFYSELQLAAERAAKGQEAATDSSGLLPNALDAKRLELEEALAATQQIRALVQRLVARSLRTGKIWTAELEQHEVSAHVKATDGSAYLIVCAEGFFNPPIIAVILDSIPGVPRDDWLAEPGGAVGIEPQPGQIIYSTMIDTDVQQWILSQHPDEGSW